MLKRTGKYRKVTVSFTQADKDIIEFLDKQPNASEFIRQAVRYKIHNKSPEEHNLEDKIKDIVSKMVSQQPPSETKDKDNDIDADVMRAIDTFDF